MKRKTLLGYFLLGLILSAWLLSFTAFVKARQSEILIEKMTVNMKKMNEIDTGLVETDKLMIEYLDRLSEK